MDRFLASVERRAFRIAVLAVANDQDALDIVQDAMIRLTRSYGDRDAQEWAPLFYRIRKTGSLTTIAGMPCGAGYSAGSIATTRLTMRRTQLKKWLIGSRSNRNTRSP